MIMFGRKKQTPEAREPYGKDSYVVRPSPGTSIWHEGDQDRAERVESAAAKAREHLSITSGQAAYLNRDQFGEQL